MHRDGRSGGVNSEGLHYEMGIGKYLPRFSQSLCPSKQNHNQNKTPQHEQEQMGSGLRHFKGQVQEARALATLVERTVLGKAVSCLSKYMKGVVLCHHNERQRAAKRNRFSDLILKKCEPGNFVFNYFCAQG